MEAREEKEDIVNLKPDTRERKRYIDAIKGFCMLLVMLGHVGAPAIVNTFLLSSSMAVYFILAGYTYKKKTEESFRDFLAGKARRLLLPYFVYSISLLLLNVLILRRGMYDLIRGGWVCFMRDIAYIRMTLHGTICFY